MCVLLKLETQRAHFELKLKVNEVLLSSVQVSEKPAAGVIFDIEKLIVECVDSIIKVIASCSPCRYSQRNIYICCFISLKLVLTLLLSSV